MRTIPFQVRWRAVFCLLGGWAWFPLLWCYLPSAAHVVEQAQGQWPFQWALLGLVVLVVAVGWPASQWLWQTQRQHHPFVHAWGKYATRSQKFLFYGTLLLFAFTLVVVIPSCASVADQYTSPRSQFIFSWVVGWWLLETIWIQGIAAVINLVAISLALCGKSPHALTRDRALHTAKGNRG